MNERIKQLDLDANLWASENYTWTPDGNDWVDVYMSKFAELIVRECSSIAFHNMALDVAAEIEQRFGVE